ncbi:MAG: hypothetical protein V3R27_11415, partial [Pseudomonadales bacterium]
LIALLLLDWPQLALAHGGVVFEEDNCVLNVGFLQAHFTAYQPQSQGSKEFCEDLPDTGETVFVVEYLHEFLKEMPVEFRVIVDVQNIGIFANWDDVQALPDIADQTVFYHPATTEPTGVLTVRHEFAEPGGYIGIVTAAHPTENKRYHAVFFFEVGYTGFGYIPLFVGLIVFAQLLFWANTGRLTRLWNSVRRPSSSV